MGKWAHRLTDIDPVTRTGTCEVCGPVRLYNRGGGQLACSTPRRVMNANRRRRTRKPYKAHKGAVCERCGFEPEHPCQLDVHHKDGDRTNHEADNCETLCANCHRIVEHRRRTNAWLRRAFS